MAKHFAVETGDLNPEFQIQHYDVSLYIFVPEKGEEPYISRRIDKETGKEEPLSWTFNKISPQLVGLLEPEQRDMLLDWIRGPPSPGTRTQTLVFLKYSIDMKNLIQ